MSNQTEIDRLEKILNSEDSTPVRITAEGKVVPMVDEGPQPPIPFSPTMHLRWMTGAPWSLPTLQQLWRCDDAAAVAFGKCCAEEWRDIGVVDSSGQSLV